MVMADAINTFVSVFYVMKQGHKTKKQFAPDHKMLRLECERRAPDFKLHDFSHCARAFPMQK